MKTIAIDGSRHARGRLQGKAALITGAGDGQGRSACLRFAAEGAAVVACELSAETGAETARLLREAGAAAVVCTGADLREEATIDAVVEAGTSAFGPIDVLYNNAVATRVGSTLGTSEEDFAFTLDGTLGIPWRVTRRVVPAMVPEGGAIVNIASITGVVGTGVVGNSPLLAIYGTAKAALLRMTEILAIELSPRGIRVNAVSPGTVETRAASAVLTGELRERHLDHLLVPRIGQPDDVVNAALFLASDEASYITGQNLVVDGGWAASGGVGVGRADVREAVAAAFGIDQTAS